MYDISCGKSAQFASKMLIVANIYSYNRKYLWLYLQLFVISVCYDTR